jgi:hypothetical protein
MTLEEFSQNVREPDGNHPANRMFLRSRLAMTEHHIAVGERYIARQREIVAELERHSPGNSETTKVAKELLQSFEMAQAGHLAGRERLQHALRSD